MDADARAEGQRFPLLAVWLASMLILAAVVFREISVFLLRIEGSSHAYGPSVFTGFHLKFWQVDDLMAAAGKEGVWSTNEAAGPFVSWHLTLDLGFAVILGLALWRALVAVSAYGDDWRITYFLVVVPPVLYTVVDVVETSYTMRYLHCEFRGLGCSFQLTENHAVLIQALSAVKWLLLAVNVTLIVCGYFWNGANGSVSWQRRRDIRRRLRADATRVTGVPIGASVVVLLLLVLLALPGGSALDQMPDVIRGQIDHVQEGDYGHAWWSAATLLLFLATLVVVVFPTRLERESADRREILPPPLMDLAVVGGGLLLSLALVLLHRHEDRSWDLPIGLAPAIVVAAIFVGALLFGRLRAKVAARHDEVVAAPVISLEDAIAARRAATRVGAAVLVGSVVLAAGLALLRATLPLVLTEGDAQEADAVSLWLGIALAGLGTVAVAWAFHRLFRTGIAPKPRVALGGVVLLPTLLLTWPLVRRPEAAERLGAVATVVVALTAWLCVVAAFAALNRHVVWRRTVQLGLGSRTPWLAMTMAVWLLAGVLDSRGGYHDTRTIDVPASEISSAARVRTLEGAFRTWAQQFGQPTTAVCDDLIVDLKGARPPAKSNNTRKIPLVLVAAPGGGGKAAYWTAVSMDRTFTSGAFCPQSLFAASGVSGGSIGLTAALARPPAQDEVEDDPEARSPEDAASGDSRTSEDAEDVVRRMTGEGPLSATVAALLLRDLPQPFTALRGRWRDRAAVLEDAWAAEAPSADFRSGVAGASNSKSLLELGDGWWTADPAGSVAERAVADAGPVLLLNGASVNDGCRALVANVRGISSGNRGCLSAPITAIDKSSGGAVSGSLDVLDPLLPARAQNPGEPDEDVDARYCTDEDARDEDVAPTQTIRALTGALLSARFPYVTPAGAMRRCLDLDDLNLSEEFGGFPISLDSLQADEDTDEVDATDRRLRSDTAYVVDGGYLENTGILSLLQLWETIEPVVQVCNVAAAADDAARAEAKARPSGMLVPDDPQLFPKRHDGCPQDQAGHLWVEPWFVMMENHYRSRVAPALANDRPAEVVVPLKTAGQKSTALGTTPMEQAIALAISRSYPSFPRDTSPVVGSCNRFVRLAPLKTPTVEAPLGWVLADDTRRGMRAAVEAAWRHNLTVYGGVANNYLQQRCSTYRDRSRVGEALNSADDRRS